MLLRQNLGRRHDTSLKTIVQCNQDAHQSHQCLPAAYIALQQTVHLSPAPHILTNFTDDPFLRSGQLKRQILFIKRMKQLAYTGKHITTVFLTTLTRILYYRKALRTSNGIAPSVNLPQKSDNAHAGALHPKTPDSTSLLNKVARFPEFRHPNVQTKSP